MVRQPERIEPPILGAFGHLRNRFRRRHPKPPEPKSNSNFYLFHLAFDFAEAWSKLPQSRVSSSSLIVLTGPQGRILICVDHPGSVKPRVGSTSGSFSFSFLPSSFSLPFPRA